MFLQIVSMIFVIPYPIPKPNIVEITTLMGNRREFFKRNFLKKEDFNFLEGVLYEDVLFAYQIFFIFRLPEFASL